MLKYCWTLYYNLPWNYISFIIHLFNHSYCKLAMNVTYMYVNINKKWIIVPLQIFRCCITFTFLEIKWHEFCPLCPCFRTAWKLMYRYSMSIACAFTIFYLVFAASYTVSAFVFVVFSIRSCWWTNKMTLRNAFLVTWPGFGRAAKRTKFWAENWQIQTVVTSRRLIRILSNFQFRVWVIISLLTKKCSCHMLFKSTDERNMQKIGGRVVGKKCF